MITEEAIDLLDNLIGMIEDNHNSDYDKALKMAIISLKKDPKIGHWVDDNEYEIDAQYGRHHYKCSECNEYADKFIGGTEDWWNLEKPNYCPWCGAKMDK